MNILASAIHDIQATRYSQLASGTIVIYDHLVTLDDEVELIWKSAWTWGKALFILNRYFGLISVIINTYGLFSPTNSLYAPALIVRPHLTEGVFLGPHFFRWQGWTGLIASMIAEVILQMRLYAMYSLNKKILALMGISFIFATTASATILGLVLSKIKALVLSTPPGLMSCVPLNIDTHFYAFWIPVLIFESLLCTLALYKGYETFKMSSPPFRSGRHLFGILIRDSVFYFIVIFATYLTNLLIFLAAPSTLLEIPIGFSVAMTCVMGNRIILNVRVVHRDLELAWNSEGLPGHTSASSGRSRSVVITPGQLSLNNVEMTQLRSMKTEISNRI